MTEPATRTGRRLDFDGGFERVVLDTARWLPAYLPQWSSRARSAPRYAFEDGRLVLEIAADQEPAPTPHLPYPKRFVVDHIRAYAPLDDGSVE